MRDFLQRLPVEVARLILSFLDPPSLLAVLQVSVSWFLAVDGDALLWRDHAERLRLRVPGCRDSELGQPLDVAAVTGADLCGAGHQWPAPSVLAGDRSRLLPSSSSSSPPPPPTSSPPPPPPPTAPDRLRLADLRAAGSTPMHAAAHVYRNLVRRHVMAEASWRTGRHSQTLSFACHDSSVIRCVLIEGEHVITGADDSTICVWQLSDGAPVRAFIGHQGGIWALQKAGRWLVSGSVDCTLHVWDYEDPARVSVLVGHTSTVRCLVATADRIVSGGSDHTVRVWDLETRQPRHVLRGHQDPVRCVAMHGGRIAVSASYDCSGRVWDTDSGRCLHVLTGHTARIYSLAFDGELIATGSLDATICVWDAQDGRCLHVLRGHRALIGSLVLRGGRLVSGDNIGEVRVWDVRGGLVRWIMPRRHSAAISCMYADDTKIVTGGQASLELWDPQMGDFVRDLADDPGFVWCVAATPTACAAACQREGRMSLTILSFKPPPPPCARICGLCTGNGGEDHPTR